VLKGMLGATAVSVGLPLLGEAQAQSGGFPTRFGTWFWGCGMNPHRWVPDSEGMGYDLKPELATAVGDLQHKITVLSGFDTPLNGRNNEPHYSPPTVTLTGDSPTSLSDIPRSTFDVEIARIIGTTTRFRTLDLTADGRQNGWSAVSAGTPAPAESSPIRFYRRVFGAGFQTGGEGEFTPDPAVMVRRSVLSAVLDQSKTLERKLGTHDRQRLDQYFTAVRQLETQLDVLLTEPPDLPACYKPDAPPRTDNSQAIDQVVRRHNLLADVLAIALACDQTRVFNLNLWRMFTDVRFPGEDVGYHQMTHDESVDASLGYQPMSQRFLVEAMGCWQHLLKALDGVPEGEGTLLDNLALFAHSGTEFPKEHGTQNIPLMVAGSAGGRIKAGQHIAGGASPTSRVVLTLQQAYGVPISQWGVDENATPSPVNDLLA
jgi:hypothetical protein